ncbi:ribonuclease HII family protein, partial [Chlamydia psittaci 84-8471/1]
MNDSKKLTPKERGKIRDILVNDPEVYYGLGVVSVERIDEINILEATKEAMAVA